MLDRFDLRPVAGRVRGQDDQDGPVILRVPDGTLTQAFGIGLLRPALELRVFVTGRRSLATSQKTNISRAPSVQLLLSQPLTTNVSDHWCMLGCQPTRAHPVPPPIDPAHGLSAPALPHPTAVRPLIPSTRHDPTPALSARDRLSVRRPPFSHETDPGLSRCCVRLPLSGSAPTRSRLLLRRTYSCPRPPSPTVRSTVGPGALGVLLRLGIPKRRR